MVRIAVFTVGVGAVLYLSGAALAPVVILGLCGIPLALLGVGMIWLGLMLTDGRSSVESALAAVVFGAGLAVVVWASIVGLWPVASWVLSEQRGGGTPWPMDAVWAVLAWSVLAAGMGAGGVALRGSPPWAMALVALLFLLLPGLSVAGFLAAQIMFRLPLTA